MTACLVVPCDGSLPRWRTLILGNVAANTGHRVVLVTSEHLSAVLLPNVRVVSLSLDEIERPRQVRRLHQGFVGRAYKP